MVRMEMMSEEGMEVLENGIEEKSHDELMKAATPMPNSNTNSNSNSPRLPPTVPASPADQNKKKRINNKGKQAENGGAGDSEVHIWTERERRKKMRTMFTVLHSLLPHLPPKADKSTIVDEAIKYISILEKDLEELEKRRMHNKCKITNPPVIELDPLPISMPPPEIKSCFQTWFSPNVVINMCGNDAQISICSIKKPIGFLTNVFYILSKHRIEVVSAHITSNPYRSMYMIHAHHSGSGTSDRFSVEQIFKLAVGEVIFCLLSNTCSIPI